jgi:hypothetical protein
MFNAEFPIEKSDITYDPEKQEVTLKREKFDALIEFVGSLLARLEDVEDQRDIESYRARRAEVSAGVMENLLREVDGAREAVHQWLNERGHSILELSKRAGIPYATCYRIIRERLATDDMEIGKLAKIVEVVDQDNQEKDIFSTS